MLTPKRLPRFFHIFRIFFKNNFIKNPQTTNARTFLPLNISAVGSVTILKGKSISEQEDQSLLQS
jgi:hypothetical protein